MMKKALFLLFIVPMLGRGQVGINTTNPDPSSILDMNSTTLGMLVPRMTETDRTNIASPATGLLIYQTDNSSGFWFYDGTAWVSLSTPPANSAWEIVGNAGTSPNINFIGTTDDQDVVFKRNNIQAGLINNNNTSFGNQSLGSQNTGFHNIAFGNKALFDNTSGNKNTAIGKDALLNNTSGSFNTALGAEAQSNNTTGSTNVAIGVQSLFTNFTGSNNIAIGYRSLYNAADNNSIRPNIAIGTNAMHSTTSGYQNTVIGTEALYSNTTGTSNIALGHQTLYNSTTASGNTAIGPLALYSNTTGGGNIAITNGALNSNITGSNNIALGKQAIYNLTDGEDNIGLGLFSLDGLTTGNRNIGIGYNSIRSNNGDNNTALGALSFRTLPAPPSQTNYSNSTALGYFSLITASNMVRIGNTSITEIGGYVNWSNVSDGRFKKNIQEDVKGLDFILKLRPITYNLDMNALAIFQKIPEEMRLKEAERLKAAEVQIGFIAQEVEKAATEINFDFHGVSAPKNTDSHYSLRYAEFVVPLVKAVQEQQQIISSQNEVIEILKERLNAIERKLTKL
jgi:trimeric autotransporter adhesin